MQAPPVGISSVSVGPIEERFSGLGSGDVLLVGCYGCTLRCSFCQNHDVSHSLPVNPSETAASWIAGEASGLRGVLFTHSEPIIAKSLVKDVSLLVRPSLVAAKTSAHCDEGTWRSFLEFVDAVNIDVKGGVDSYRDLCEGNLGVVIRNASIAKSMRRHVELTFLVIPGMEEGLSEAMRRMSHVCGDASVRAIGFVPANRMSNWPMARKNDVDRAADKLRWYFKDVRASY